MSEKQEKRITVYHQERYDSPDWPPTNAVGFMTWMQGKLDLIPTEYRASAIIEFDSASGYEGEHYPEITISYDRMETDEEVEARLEARRQELAQEEQQLVARLERLRSQK